jgi:hypothetical protein
MKKTIYADGIVVGELDVVTGDYAREIEQVTEFLRSKGVHRERRVACIIIRPEARALRICAQPGERHADRRHPVRHGDPLTLYTKTCIVDRA